MAAVDDYLATLEAKPKVELERIRTFIRQIVPDATEGISYGIPAFKYKGTYLIGYAAFKHHLSLFPGAAPIEQFAKELTDYQTSKGTVQFTLERPLPDSLIRKIVMSRLDTISKEAKA